MNAKKIRSHRGKLFGFGLSTVLMVAIPAAAHHGLQTYDMTKKITLTGKIVKFEWTNPHCRIHLDVPNSTGIVHWNFETYSPNVLTRAGWTKNSLKIRQDVTVIAFPAKVGTTSGVVDTIILGNGQQLTPLPYR